MNYSKQHIILALSVFILAICGIYLGNFAYNSYSTSKNLSYVQSLVGDVPPVDATLSADGVEQYADNGMLLGYYNAYCKNNDMIGWVKIDDTKINYPVMQRGDNEYYLDRNFNHARQSSGLPFLDMQCDILLPSNNMIIYGHNMRDGSMFAPLLKYKDKNFYDEHKTVVFDTLFERGKYTVIAVFSTKVGSENEFKYYEYTDMSAPDFNYYVETAKSLSLYETGETAVWGDELLTLSTCSYNRSNERLVVLAKKIK